MQIILKIYGKVQGVFFRDSSRMKARELNLSGFARNELDGTVQIVAEGEEEKLKEFIEWCKNAKPAPEKREGWQGPDHAKVEKVEIEWKESAKQFNDFTVE